MLGHYGGENFSLRIPRRTGNLRRRDMAKTYKGFDYVYKEHFGQGAGVRTGLRKSEETADGARRTGSHARETRAPEEELGRFLRSWGKQRKILSMGEISQRHSGPRVQKQWESIRCG